MGGLYKKEILIRPTSDITVQGAKDFAKNWLNNTFQEKASNKDENGNYIDYFFGDVFDARTGNIYRVFSDACADKYDMDTLNFDILNVSEFAKAEELQEIETKVSENTDRVIALENANSDTTAFVLENEYQAEVY